MSEKKYKSLRMRALVSIEYITASISDWTDQQEMMSLVYMFSHVAIGRCTNKHEEWEQKLIDFYNEVDAG